MSLYDPWRTYPGPTPISRTRKSNSALCTLLSTPDTLNPQLAYKLDS